MLPRMIDNSVSSLLVILPPPFCCGIAIIEHVYYNFNRAGKNCVVVDTEEEENEETTFNDLDRYATSGRVFL